MTRLVAQTGDDASRIADSVQRIERELAERPSLDDQLLALATFASIVLALLAIFTTRRTELLGEQQEEGLPRFRAGGWKKARGDVALIAATTAALATMAPSFRTSVDIVDWFDRSHTLASMFSLTYVGFAAMLFWQARILWRRVTS